jgi:TonB family protein
MSRDKVASLGYTRPPLNADVRAPRMQILSCCAVVLIAVSTALDASCTTSTTARHQETPPDMSSKAERTLPRLDPSHLPHVGQAYYPRESLEIPEEGICKMSVTIEPDGSVSASHLVDSSGFPRLDAACMNAFPADVRFIPATTGGNPVKRTIILPIVWCLGVDCITRLH